MFPPRTQSVWISPHKKCAEKSNQHTKKVRWKKQSAHKKSVLKKAISVQKKCAEKSNQRTKKTKKSERGEEVFMCQSALISTLLILCQNDFFIFCLKVLFHCIHSKSSMDSEALKLQNQKSLIPKTIFYSCNFFLVLFYALFNSLISIWSWRYLRTMPIMSPSLFEKIGKY